jgi:uncharacterized repeat protein (TIGR03803 family)
MMKRARFGRLSKLGGIAFCVFAMIAIADYAMATSSSATIHSFGAGVGDGAQPKGSLTNVNGILFGRTTATFKVVKKEIAPGVEILSNKGVKLGGVIFSIDPSDDTYTIAHNFRASKQDGFNPRHDAMTLLNGVMYGSALQGGKGGGTTFSINGNGSAYTKLDDLASRTGDQQHSCFVVINNVLCAMTAAGGSHKGGVIYSVNLDGSQFTVLHNFKSSAGDKPHGRLTYDGTHLYGMTKAGGGKGGSFNAQGQPLGKLKPKGVIFSIDPDGTNYTVLHTFFGGADDGATTDHGYLVLDSNNVLYGMTTFGGSANKGVILRINTDGSGFTLLHSFVGGANDGASPLGSLLINGTDLYGTTASGGASNMGTVFHIRTDGGAFSILHSFSGNPDGRKPIDNVVPLNGTLYGMTVFGGAFDQGAIFAIPLN